ncbi:hypothetical protein J437_LFUL018869 [Ladona fulva]|uniref:Uncharacterized protein n=1 Tax=Ladona fulva TaxID=123851 RepID=A0A8K0KSQ6_LADFU|nr:hypothetical protein J437_LFUL018869 [Ladona fulva]
MKRYPTHHHHDFRRRDYACSRFATPFDVKIDNEGNKRGLEDELIGICVDLEAKALFKNKNLSENNIGTKYPKLRVKAFPFLLHSQLHTWLKLRDGLNLENRVDLRLKLTNFHPNINKLAASLQTHPSR